MSKDFHINKALKITSDADGPQTDMLLPIFYTEEEAAKVVEGLEFLRRTYRRYTITGAQGDRDQLWPRIVQMAFGWQQLAPALQRDHGWSIAHARNCAIDEIRRAISDAAGIPWSLFN